jgi:hypothetical protein
MNQDEELLKKLIAGGLVGGALGALITKNKGDGFLLGALAGAALLATFKAHEQAQRTDVPLLVEEEGSIYEIQSGVKRFIKKIEKPVVTIPERFKLN